MDTISDDGFEVVDAVPRDGRAGGSEKYDRIAEEVRAGRVVRVPATSSQTRLNAKASLIRRGVAARVVQRGEWVYVSLRETQP